MHLTSAGSFLRDESGWAYKWIGALSDITKRKKNKDIDFPWPIARIALQHHERMDGSGYPAGLKGDEILIASQILMVADVVEAIASNRPYRPALGIEIALKELSQQRGKLYNPVVADACLKLFNEKGFSFD